MEAAAIRVALVAAWIGVLVALASWSETTPALVCAGVATVGAGLLVGRWWVTLVPIVPALVLVVGLLASGRDPSERWEASPGAYAVGVVMACGVAVGLLALGVAIRKTSVAARRVGRRGRLTSGTGTPAQ